MILLLFEIGYIEDGNMIFDDVYIDPSQQEEKLIHNNLNFIFRNKGFNNENIKILEDSTEHLTVIINKNTNPSIDDDKLFMKIGYTNPINLNEIMNEVIVVKELNKKEYKLNGFSKLIAYSPITEGAQYEYIRDSIEENMDIDAVIFKYINGVSFKDFLKVCDIDQFISVLQQIVYTLYEANVVVGFTHYDLHLSNIMVETLKIPINKYYSYLNKTITTKYVMTIIDAGVSFINTKPSGADWAVAGLSRETWWVHDIFKIFMFIYAAVDENHIIKERDNLNPSNIVFNPDENPSIFFDFITLRTDITKENKVEYTILKDSFQKDLSILTEAFNNNVIYEDKKLEYYRKYNKLTTHKLIKDYNADTDKIIIELEKNKEKYSKIMSLISNTMYFFEVVLDDEGTPGTIEEILRLHELGILEFFQIPRSIAFEVKDNDFQRFVKYFDSMVTNLII